ncbi:MAG: uracil-DNA glycosylase [Alphaproteobacteria bacterium]|nr:uracil-DNA glycosylase [Alphaproteobacteria bacterium]
MHPITCANEEDGLDHHQEPSKSCNLCPRLFDFRQINQTNHTDWFNAPVPSFGADDPQLLIIGLAPGLKGANRTGRPFTGDFAGILLYQTLIKYGFAQGVFDERIDDGLKLVNCKITNAVRCVPPENKPTPVEIKTCQQFLKNTLSAQKKLKVIVTLGKIAHDSLLDALGFKKSLYPFGHESIHHLKTTMLNDIVLISSYHCSKYNTSTKRLTEEMFHKVFEKASFFLK